MPSDRIVHVVDDDDAVRHSFGFALGAAGYVYRLHASAIDLLKVLPGQPAGCIITDVRMPEMDGIALLRRLNDLGLGVPAIVITGHADVPLAVAALKAGAFDFIEKPVDTSALLAVVDAALHRQEADAQNQALLGEIRRRAGQLSGRENDVLGCLVEGLANKVIAARLGISPRTVEVHRARLMDKMQARSLSELVRMALQLDPRT